MESLKKVTELKLDSELQQVVGGKKVPNYSNTWWWKGLDYLGNVAEAGSALWGLKYP